MNAISGIYLIMNKINNKKYIGQASNIKTRWTHHKTDLRCGCHHNRHLQASWNKYGEENFVFSIIEECSEECLNDRESYWINYYNSYNNGYNLDHGGNGIRGYVHTEEEIEKMRRIKKPMIILQFDSNFNFIKEWMGGASHISKELKYTRECILLRCDHRIKEMSLYKDSYWIYKDEYYNEDFSWDKYLNNIKLVETCKPIIKNSKRIMQYTKDRQLIRIWDSYSELKKAGYNTSQISGICHQSRGKRTAANYIWCFEGYDFSDGYFDILNTYKNKTTEARKRKISRLDKDGNVLQTYNSLTEASKDVGVDVSCICFAYKKGRKSAGFYWAINE